MSMLHLVHRREPVVTIVAPLVRGLLQLELTCDSFVVLLQPLGSFSEAEPYLDVRRPGVGGMLPAFRMTSPDSWGVFIRLCGALHR